MGAQRARAVGFSQALQDFMHMVRLVHTMRIGLSYSQVQWFAEILMGYLIQLEEDGGGVLDQIKDGEGWLEAWAFDLGSDSLRLGDLDPGGETWFNRIQAGRVMEEAAALRHLAVNNHQQVFLIRLMEMLERCRDGMGLWVVFRGV
jgi:hypothetical protein